MLLDLSTSDPGVVLLDLSLSVTGPAAVFGDSFATVPGVVRVLSASGLALVRCERL